MRSPVCNPSLQEQHYEREFPLAERSLIMVGRERAGRLIIDRRGDEIHIVDISILPEHRGRGVGSALIEERAGRGRIERPAGPAARGVVESGPAALRAPRVRPVGTTGAHLALEWRPEVGRPAF